MSCEAHRRKAFKDIAAKVGASPEELEKIFSAHRSGAVTKLVNAAKTAAQALDGRGASTEAALLEKALAKFTSAPKAHRRGGGVRQPDVEGGKTVHMHPSRLTPLDEAAVDLCGDKAVVGVMEHYDGYVEHGEDSVTERRADLRLPMGYDAQGRAVKMNQRATWWSEHDFYEVGEPEGVRAYLKEQGLDQSQPPRVAADNEAQAHRALELIEAARKTYDPYEGQSALITSRRTANGQPQHFYEGGWVREWDKANGKPAGKELEIVRVDRDRVWARVDKTRIRAFAPRQLVVTVIPSGLRAASDNREPVPPFHLRDEEDDEIGGPYFTYREALTAMDKAERVHGDVQLCNGYSNSVEI